MDLDAAKTAGDIAAQIAARQDMMTKIQAAIDAGWQVSEFKATDPATGRDMSLILAKLDAATSIAALGFAMQIFQTQLDALNAQLAALK